MSEVEILQQIDRLVSASSPSDAISSLSTITQSLSLQSNNNQNETESSSVSVDVDGRRKEVLQVLRVLAESEEFMTALCSLFSESTLSSIPNVIDGGDATACEFLSAVLSFMDSNANAIPGNANVNATIAARSREQWKFQSNAQLKKFLANGKLTHAILDLLSHSTSTNNSAQNGNGNASSSRTTTLYAKISAIQSLSKLTSTNPTLIHSLILSAPDGLHRIIDLLNPAPIEEESVRNEALLLCRIMAETNAGSARLMIFGEAYEKVFDIAMDDGVGYAVRGDCLKLCIEMTRQDEMGSDVFLGNGMLVRNLIRFLDLRMGKNFASPEQELHGDGDDLDDILNSSKGGNDDGGNEKKKKAKVPFLTEEEGEVTMLALEFLRVLIVGDESGEVGSVKMQARQKTVLAHNDLSRFLIDMALYTLPPPDSPRHVYVSAVPTLHVQMRALDVISVLALGSGEESQQLILSRRGIYLNAGVLDRVMYLICTGDGANRGSELDGGANKISMHCLGVLRCLLSAKEASMMMMHTLAPPPPEDDDAMAMPLDVPVVQKLVNTLGENLHVLLSADIRKELKVEDKTRISRMIIGAAGALGIFFTNGAGETTREMILRVPMPPPPPSPVTSESESGSVSAEMDTPPPSLMECVISYIEFCSNDLEILSESSDVVAALLRLVIEWVPSTPKVISELLSSASSISLGVLLQHKYKKNVPPTTQALSAMLLGLCMDNMKANDEMGGWSISSIMNLINVGLGIGKYTQLLESLKTFMVNNDDDNKGVGPWACCLVERSHFMQWYKDAVNLVRKRTVQELTISNGNDSDSEMEDVGQVDETRNRDAKAMKKLVSQQTMEIDALHSKLAEAEESLLVQSTEAKTLKKRLESNPSQLDDLMNECTSKISELEIQNRSLSSKLSSQENDFKEIISQKDTAASQLHKDLEQACGEVSTLIEDKKVMQEEVAGLTSAYTTLEGEFNRVSSQIGPSSQTNGDTTSEGSMPMFASQMMKDENAKLKNNMRAANDWMKEAVKRHDDLSKRNIALEEELKTARASSNDASRASIDLASVNLSLSASERQVADVKSDREHLRSNIESLEKKLSLAEIKEYQNTVNIKANDNIAKLSTQIEEMKHEMATDSKQYAASVAGLEQSLVSKDQIISALETRINEAESKLKLSQTQSQGQKESNDEKIKLQGEINKLSAANKSAQDWMSTAVKRHNSLKVQVQDLQRSNSNLQSELEKQDTSHPETAKLQKDIEDISRERDRARNQMVELEATLIDLQTSEEKKAAETSKELDGLSAQLIERQQEIQVVTEKLAVAESKFTSERQQLLDDRSKSQSSLREKENEVELLTEELNNAKRESELSGSEFDEQNATVSQLITERQVLQDENEILISQKEEHLAAIEDMKNRLTEFHSWTETAQQRIGELEMEKETSESRIQELELEFKSTKALLEQTQSQLEHTQELKDSGSIQVGGEGTDENELKADLSAAREEISNFHSERMASEIRIKDLEECAQAVEGQFDDVQLKLQTSKDEYDALKEISDTEEAELKRLWAEVSDARQRIADLEDEKAASHGKIKELEQNRVNTKDECEDLRVALQNSEDELDALNENMGLDESTLENFKLQLSTAEQKYTELENEFEISQNQVRELEAEREASTTRIQELTQSEGPQLANETSIINERELDILRSNISNLEMQLSDFDGRNRALAEENKALEQINTDLRGKAELLDEVEENLFEKEQEGTELAAALSMARKETTELQEECETAIASWKEKSDDLEAEIARLETVFTGQQEEAKQAILLWEERCSLLEGQIANLGDVEQLEEFKIQLSVLQEDLSAKDAMLDEIKADVQIEKNNVEMLSKEKSESENIFKRHIDELEVAVQEHVTANEQLQDELETKEDVLTETEQQIEVLTKELVDSSAQSEEVVVQWQENTEELEHNIADLETTLSEQRAQATVAIEQWESRCNGFSEQIQNLMEEADNETLQQIEELKLEVAEKEKQMQEHQTERGALIKANESLTTSVEDLHAKNAALENSLCTERNKVDGIDKTCKELQICIDELKEELLQSREAKEEVAQAYKAREEGQAEKMSSILDEKSRLQEAVHMSEGEINEFKMIIGHLEVELAEANDALQSLVTDEVTVRATEKAATALRSQIKGMRDKQIFDHQAFSNEKDARLAAEDEVHRLKADLGLLAKASGSVEGKEEQIQMMTSKAAAEIMHQERQEIEDLQRSLEHVMNELKSSKLKERDAEDRAANSRMHASVCEQELVSTTADIDFLRQSLDEGRQSESEMQSLLENRIQVLEDDRQRLMNTNRADVEATKAELSNIIVERDQLIYALNESEKANSTLVYSTTVNDDKNNQASIEAELSKVRMENAQLLSATSKSAAQTERRIRNALAGESSIVEDCIKSENKRREEAERSLETLNQQYDDMSKEQERIKTSNDELITKLKNFEANNVEDDMKRIQADFSRLEVEKMTLESKLNETVSKSTSNITKLEEKCRVAEAEIRKLKSAEHKEAAFSAEVAKMREEISGRNSSVSAATTFDDMTERKGPDIDPGDQLDLIRELQSEMSQERDMYQDLLSEHEDLLALLAQQDCEKKCLQQALTDADGKDAVERAILAAEEKVVQQFGKYVQIK